MEDLLKQISFDPEYLNDDIKEDKPEGEDITKPTEEAESDQEIEETQDSTTEAETEEEDSDDSQPEDGEQQEEEPSLIDILRQEYEIEDEFENTPEGLRKFTSAVIDKRSQLGAQQQMEKYFETYPDVAEYIQLRRSGYEPDDVYEMIKGMQLPESVSTENTEQQKVIQRMYYQRKGFSDERINRMIKVSEEEGTLYNDSEDFLKEMKETDTQARQQRQQELEQKEQQQRQQIETYWKEVESTIKEGKIMNFNIPESEKTKFFNYIAQAVDKNGNTQELLDRKQMSTEQQLALRWLFYKKFDLGEYIKAKAKGESLNKLLKSKEKSSNRMKGGSNRSSDVGIDHLKNVQF